jgi:hypothetical protein
MFNELPNEIVVLIYEFDSTFKDLFNIVLHDLTKVRLSTINDFAYYIFDPNEQCIHMTNDFNNPFYICTSYNINCLKYLEIKKKFGLIEIDYDLNSLFDYSTFSLNNLLNYQFKKKTTHYTKITQAYGLY